MPENHSGQEVTAKFPMTPDTESTPERLDVELQAVIEFMRNDPFYLQYVEDFMHELSKGPLPPTLVKEILHNLPRDDKQDAHARLIQLEEKAHSIQIALDILYEVDEYNERTAEDPEAEDPEWERHYNGYTFFTFDATDEIEDNPPLESKAGQVEGLLRLVEFDKEFYQQPILSTDQGQLPTPRSYIYLQYVQTEERGACDDITIARWNTDEFVPMVRSLQDKGAIIMASGNWSNYHIRGIDYLAVLPTDDPVEIECFIRDNLPPKPELSWQNPEDVKVIFTPRFEGEPREPI